MNSKINKVLLTDGNYKHTWAAARALSDEGYIVDVIGGNRSITSKSNKIHDAVFSERQLNKKNLNSFIDLLKLKNYDVVLGIGASSIEFLSEFEMELSQYTNLILPPRASLMICLHKDSTLEFARSLSIKVPTSYNFNELNHLNSFLNLNKKQFIIKGNDEISKDFPTYYVSSEQDLERNFVRDLFTSDKKFIVQERILGVGEAFFAVYNKGVMVDFFMHQRLRENPLSGGPSTKAKTIYKQDLYESGKLLLDKLNWHGVAMVEFKRDKDNNLFLMEINPKFWGSLDLALKAEVNFPAIAVSIALGQEPPPRIYHAKQITYQWPFDGDLNLAVKHPHLAPKILIDIVNPRVSKNIYMNDLRPTLNTILNNVVNSIFQNNRFNTFKSLAYKINSLGLKFGFVRWWTELFGYPFLRYSKISQEIFIGGRLSRFGINRLRWAKIASVLNLQSEVDDLALGMTIDGYEHLKLKEFEAISINDFLVGIEFLNKQIEMGRKTYIHCAEGVGRAPSMMAAYLMSKGYSLSTALKIIEEKRPFINLTDDQRRSLQEFSSYLN